MNEQQNQSNGIALIYLRVSTGKQAEKGIAMADEELVDEDHGGLGKRGIGRNLRTRQRLRKAVLAQKRLNPLEAPLQRAHHAILVARRQPRLPLIHPACVSLLDHWLIQFYQRSLKPHRTWVDPCS